MNATPKRCRGGADRSCRYEFIAQTGYRRFLDAEKDASGIEGICFGVWSWRRTTIDIDGPNDYISCLAVGPSIRA